VVTIIPLALAPEISSRPGTAVPLVNPLKVLFCLALVGLYVAIAVAILKYRRYKIDIVISKAVQYGTLAVFISASTPGSWLASARWRETGAVRCCRPSRPSWWHAASWRAAGRHRGCAQQPP
jgi:hypothetical protein